MTNNNICPNCGFSSEFFINECPKCGIFIDKYYKLQDKKIKQDRMSDKLEYRLKNIDPRFRDDRKNIFLKHKWTSVTVVVFFVAAFSVIILSHEIEQPYVDYTKERLDDNIQRTSSNPSSHHEDELIQESPIENTEPIQNQDNGDGINENTNSYSHNREYYPSPTPAPIIRERQQIEVRCQSCNGTGQIEGWSWGKRNEGSDMYGNPTNVPVQVPTPKPCPVCNGLGYRYQTVYR